MLVKQCSKFSKPGFNNIWTRNFQIFKLVLEKAEETEIKLPTSVAAAAKSLQSCPTLCNPIDNSPPGCPIPGILQARTLEWVDISFSNAWKWKVKGRSLSRFWLLATPWTAIYQAPLSMGFSSQKYCSRLPLPSPNIHWIIKKARQFQKNIYFSVIDYAKAFDCVDRNKLWNILRDGNTRPPDLPLEKPVCRSGSNS